MATRKLRVMVIDDSTLNRRGLADLIAGDPELELCSVAADGEEGLKQALVQKPDAIVLDLQMPRVDGFTFLRLLMAKRPTPVVVVSSAGKKEEAFRALELGAIDFVARPSRPMLGDEPAAQELLHKLKGVRLLTAAALRPRTPTGERPKKAAALAVIGASTGGPPALTTLLEKLPQGLPMAVLIAQHMPEKFTRAFAERINRTASFEVAEAVDAELVLPGRALIAPGGPDMLLRRSGGELRVRVVPSPPEHRYRPSVDALFDSVAEVLRVEKLPTMGVVLTGMGNDGAQGIAGLKDAGAVTVAESPQSAVIFGMPKEAIATGKVDRVLDIAGISDALIRFGKDGR
jgi:two-component system chemotaxis response regulator CheB